jgi:hypothetical protein
MTHPLADTIELPTVRYLTLLTQYCKGLLAENDKDLPRTEELKAVIEAEARRAASAGVMLDDQSVKVSPLAAEIRANLDRVMPEFQELANAAAKRLAMGRTFREKAAALNHDQPTVAVAVGEVMVLLGLAAPEFWQNTAKTA